MKNGRQLHLNPALSFERFDTAATEPTYLVTAGNGRRFEISETMYRLLSLIMEEADSECVASAFSKATGRDYSAGDIETIARDFLIPNGLIQNAFANNEGRETSYLYWHRSLFPQETLLPITNLLRYLFAKPVLLVLVPILGLFHFYFYALFGKPGFSLSRLTVEDATLVYGIVFLTTLLHELGHSSACNRFGAKHGSIGIGLYLYFLVFYADVSDVWRLKRTERAVVDFAGMYFQMISLPLLFFLYEVSSNSVFIYAIYVIDFQIVTCLNPFFRFDGYWMFADLAGIPNLRKKVSGMIRYALSNVFRLESKAPPPVLKIKSGHRHMLYLYALASNLFFAFFIWQVWLLMQDALRTYPADLLRFLPQAAFEIRSFDVTGLMHEISNILFPSLLFLMISITAFRSAARLIAFTRRTLRKRSQTKPADMI